MDKKSKVHHSEASMLALISQWQSSGISQNIFCKQQGLPYSVFQYWLKKFRKSSEEPKSGFLEMKIPEEVISSETKTEIEIIFPSGARVVFKSQPETSFLRSLVF